MTTPTLRAAAAALVAALLVACGPLAKVDLWSLATSGRDGWQRPERVIEALEIQPGDSVAEIGAGDGYWIGWLSEAVGPGGRVYAVEVEDDKVEELQARVARDHLGNVEVVRGQYEDPLLPDGRIDLAITCLTYHHIEERSAYFARLRKDLSARGRVAHLDDRDDLPGVLGWLPSEGHWMNVEEMNREMSAAGYERIASFDFLLVQSFQIFAPAGGGGAAKPALDSGTDSSQGEH